MNGLFLFLSAPFHTCVVAIAVDAIDVGVFFNPSIGPRGVCGVKAVQIQLFFMKLTEGNTQTTPSQAQSRGRYRDIAMSIETINNSSNRRDRVCLLS